MLGKEKRQADRQTEDLFFEQVYDDGFRIGNMKREKNISEKKREEKRRASWENPRKKE